MDTTITAAIIAAITTAMSSIIGILIHRHKVATSIQRFEKSKALRLGYVLQATECYLDAQNWFHINLPNLTRQEKLKLAVENKKQGGTLLI